MDSSTKMEQKMSIPSTIISKNLEKTQVFADLFCRNGDIIYLCTNNLTNFSMILNLVILGR